MSKKPYGATLEHILLHCFSKHGSSLWDISHRALRSKAQAHLTITTRPSKRAIDYLIHSNGVTLSNLPDTSIIYLKIRNA
jgi:hypothetical protein